MILNCANGFIFYGNETFARHKIRFPDIKVRYTQCIIQKFHGVYVRDTCFMRFLEFHETVSLNRTLLYFLKLVSFTSSTALHFVKISLPVIPANLYTQLRKGSSFRSSSTKAWLAPYVFFC